MNDKPRQIRRIAGALVLMLAGCTGNGAGGSVDNMRQMISGGQPPAQLAAQPTPYAAQIVPTTTPDFSDVQPAMQAQPTTLPVYIEATPAPQPAAIVAGIDESAQPCPARYWHRGRCTATAAQLAAYAQQGGK